MATLTMDAALAVEATSLDFPATFPWFFGPNAATALGHSADASLACTASFTASTSAPNVAATALAATATTSASMSLAAGADASMAAECSARAGSGKAWLVDASLIVTTYAVFPYTFPFVFEQSFDTASRGQTIDAQSTLAEAAMVATGTRGAIGDATQEVVASTYVTAMAGGERIADVALAATATLDAAMSQNHVTSSALPVTAGANTQALAALRADAHQAATATTAAMAPWQARCSAELVAGAATSSAASIAARAAASAEALVSFLVESARHQYAQASLNAVADAHVSQFHDVIIDAGLSVRAHTTVTVPEPTGFWNFYLR